MKARALLNTAPHSNKKNKDKKWVEKNVVRDIKKIADKRKKRGGVRTGLHGLHLPDVPCGEITIECKRRSIILVLIKCITFFKHCKKEQST